MRKCLMTCKKLSVACPIKDCRFWIDYEGEYNCTFETVEENGPMTLREISERLGVSYVRIKQIQDVAVKKIGHFFEKEAI